MGLLTRGNEQLSYLTELAGYVVDTGSANAYAVALDPAITTYTTGLLVKWQAVNANTGVSTLAINGLSAKPLKRNVNQALGAGDIVANSIIECFYDGTNFQITSIIGINSSGVTQQFSAYNDMGESTPLIPTYTVTQVDSSGVWADHFHDGPSIAYLGRRIFILGGWNGTDTPNATDLIRYSDDEGVTWADWGHTLPYKGHSMIVIQSQDGWWYIIGGDSSTSTSTNRKTVTRTKDFVTFETRTTNAEWASSPGGDRVLAAGFALDNGKIAIMGGQNPTGWAGYDDIWTSSDGGATWVREQSSIVVGGNHFLGQNIDKCVIRRGDKVYVIGGGVYDDNPANRTYTAKCYVASIYDLSTWIRIDDSPLGNRQYAYCGLWDGMIWQVNGVDSGSTNQYGTVFLDKNNKWHDLHVTYRGTLMGQMSISHAAPVYGIGGAMYRIGGNDENQAWKITRSINYFPEAAVPFFGDFALGQVALGGKYKFGINCEDANITSGHVIDIRGGKGKIENDSFAAFTISTATVANNATALELNGGGTKYYLYAGGSSGSLANQFGLYQDGTNYLLFRILDNTNTQFIDQNPSSSPVADTNAKLTVQGRNTGQTTSRKIVYGFDSTSTFNTTGGALTSWGGYFSATATRSAGGNDLVNVGIYAEASGGQKNYAAQFSGSMKIDLGSDATGDVYYRNSSGNFVRLGIGNTNDLLTVTSGIPSWQPAVFTANNTFLQGQTAGVDPVLTFTTVDAGLYRVEIGFTVNSISVDVIEIRVTYVDQRGTSRTQTFSTIGGLSSISATGSPVYPSMDIWSAASNDIVVKTVLTTGIGSINYDIAAGITKVFITPF